MVEALSSLLKKRERLVVVPALPPLSRLLAMTLLPAPYPSRGGRPALTPPLHRFDKGGRSALVSCVAWSLYSDGSVINPMIFLLDWSVVCGFDSGRDIDGSMVTLR